MAANCSSEGHGPLRGAEDAVPKPVCLELSPVQASGSWDKTIHIWKPSTRSLLIQLKGHITWVKSSAFSPDGQQLASAALLHMVTPPGLPANPYPTPSQSPEQVQKCPLPYLPSVGYQGENPRYNHFCT